jgi:hypothetical protein
VTSDESLVVFLDANVLAKPVTRPLILRCAASGYTAGVERAAASATEHPSRSTSRHRLATDG